MVGRRPRVAHALILFMLVLSSVPLGIPGVQAIPSNWLNQDWADDGQFGCTLSRDGDGRWRDDGAWYRADASRTEGDDHDSRLITDVINVGDAGFTLSFDFDYLGDNDGTVDIGQIIIVKVFSSGFTSCTDNESCQNDATELADSDSVIWCRFDNDFGFGETIEVPASKASGDIRLMFRYYNDAFRGWDSGYWKIKNINVDVAPAGDTEPPTTTIDVNAEPTCHPDWDESPATVTLSAVDNPARGASGVAATYYRVDNGPTQTYSGPFQVTGDGVHTIEYWSTDNAGNEEAHRTQTIRIDSTAPASSIDVGSPQWTSNHWYVSSLTPFTITSSDDGSGVASIEYRVNGGAWTAYAGAFTLDGPDGPYTVEARATDVACHDEEPPVSVDVFLDNTEPTVTIVEPTAVAASDPTGAEQVLEENCGTAFSESVCGTATGQSTPSPPPAVQQGVPTATSTADGACRMALAAGACDATTGAASQAADQIVSGENQTDAPDGTTVVTGTTTVVAEIEDPVVNGGASEVAYAQFYVDGILRHTDSTAPYEWEWDTSQESQGNHELKVVGYDHVENAGQQTLVVTVL